MCSTFAGRYWSLPAAVPSDLVWCLPALLVRSFPASSFCPGAEEATEVFLSGHTRMSGLKGASGFSCSFLQSHLLPSFWWCRCAGRWVSGNFGVAQAENQVRSSSCTAPAAVPRKNALIQQFYCFIFLNLVIAGSLAFELLLLN